MADLFLQSTRPTKLYLGSTEVLKVYCGSVLVWPILAVLSTSAISVYAATTATAGGNITSDGGSSITDRGICWSTSANPTISDSHTHDGTGTGSFTSNMTGLTASTLYHFRAYATNSGGTSYGSDISFTTAAMILPAISELTFPNGAGETTMDIQTYIAENGGGSILEMGVVYSTTNSTPTTADSKFTTTPVTGQSIVYVTGLTKNTYYYWRVFARNSAGTAYYPSSGFGYATTEYM